MTVDHNISSRINLMRILLISGIVFVHVPSDPATSPFLGANGLFDWIRVFLGDSLFRIGVPCLSAISGYLLFQRGWDKFDYVKTLRSKATTVLLPFLLWNLSLFTFVLIIQRAGAGIGYFPDLWHASPRDVLTHAFAAEGLPLNIPLYFLRDLMVCIVLSPLLAVLVRRLPALTLIALFVVAVVPDISLGLVLKKSILFSFTFGIFLSLRQADLKALDRFSLAGSLLLLAAAVLLSVALYFSGPEFPWVLDLARNTLSIVGAGGFWLVSAIMIRSRVGQRLSSTGSLSFWIFCAHYPLLVILWMVWNRLAADALYPLFYVLAIIISFSVLIATNSFASTKIPRLYEVLTGSRGRKAKDVSKSKPATATPVHPVKSALTQQPR